MKIGFAYDLRLDYLKRGFTEEETAEFDSEETIGFVSGALASLGHDVDRIGSVYDLVKRLAAGERWDLVFNITEGLYGRSREAQVPALLEAYQIPYTFSDPLTLALSLDKAMTKTVVRAAGVLTPDFYTVSSLQELNRPAADAPPFPNFVKPLSEGTGKGVTPASIVRNARELEAQCATLLERYAQPVLVEAYLPGREFTVGILGTGAKARAVGVLEVALREGAEPLVYSYLNKELCEQYVDYVLVRDDSIIEEASVLALRAYAALGCRDAGRVDFKADAAGRLFFLEINPLAGIHPTHSDLPILCRQAGMSYEALLAAIVSSALERGNPSVVYKNYSAR